MAVQAVSGVSETPVTGNMPPAEGGQKDYTKMTPKEILEAEKNGETIPPKILAWAKENPDGKDAVAYQASLEEQGMSLKEQCKIFTDLSAQKETRDLQNVTKMAPYTQQVPTDDQTGAKGTSEVSKAFAEIKQGIKFKGFFGGKEFFDGIRFYQALHEGTSNELDTIDYSLEAIQSVLDGAIGDAQDSKQYGEETVNLGRELKSHTKWWQFKGSRRKAAKKAIEQGELTVKMSERTDKLAQAIAKDNGVALKNSKDNIKQVDLSVLQDEGQKPARGQSGGGENNQ